MNISFRTMKEYCRWAGFCKISCKHYTRALIKPPFFPLCLEKKCPAVDHVDAALCDEGTEKNIDFSQPDIMDIALETSHAGEPVPHKPTVKDANNE